MLRRDHASHTARSHDLADADWWYVRASIVQPAAHCGIERDVHDSDEELSLARLGHRLGAERPVGRHREPLRARRKAPLAVGRGAGGEGCGTHRIRLRAWGW